MPMAMALVALGLSPPLVIWLHKQFLEALYYIFIDTIVSPTDRPWKIDFYSDWCYRPHLETSSVFRGGRHCPYRLDFQRPYRLLIYKSNLTDSVQV